MFLLRLLLGVVLAFLASCASGPKTSADCYRGPKASIHQGHVIPPRQAPDSVRRAIAAANAIQNTPYQYGGGHGRPSHGLDCSGCVSHVLGHAGLLQDPMPSKAFRHYGRSGQGQWITVFARSGHVFMTICGLRLDTSSRGGGTGPRWSAAPRSTKGFALRHPSGL